MENKTITKTLNKQEYQAYFEKGISYEQYITNMTAEVEEKKEGQYAHYVPMNLQRTKRVGKTIELQAELLETLNLLHHPLNWLVISEHWCGDASQILPIINAVAAASRGFINLRIVYRDENVDLMDAHLTNGGRAIPKLIQLDTKFSVTGIWGPRPNKAQKLVWELKANPLTAPTYAEKLHKWYADDKTISTQRDLLKLLKIAVAFCPDCV